MNGSFYSENETYFKRHQWVNTCINYSEKKLNTTYVSLEINRCITTSEATARRCSIKKMFWKISQYLKENTNVGVSSLINYLPAGILLKKRLATCVLLITLWKFFEHTFYRMPPVVYFWNLCEQILIWFRTMISVNHVWLILQYFKGAVLVWDNFWQLKAPQKL